MEQASLPVPASDRRSAPVQPSGLLKGRKRFVADLAELKAHPELISHTTKWSFKNVRSGDEEGSVEIVLINIIEEKTQIVSLLVSDTSEYPNSHTYFGYSQDAAVLEPDADVAKVIDRLPDKAGRALRDVAEFFVIELSRGDCDVDEDGGDDDTSRCIRSLLRSHD
ncbi:hypothetical protein BS17DRAFT_881328 [Gyrodon lividus]|nr:hypothetical protein BS17DRAFT_881328 [Gyrodon lividus]